MAIRDNLKMKSYVGKVIHSRTLDTMEKVIAIYGGTTWEKIEGMFLLGQSDSYPIGSTGGEATHTLTVDELAQHRHSVSYYQANGVSSGGSSYVANTTDSWWQLDSAYMPVVLPSSENTDLEGGNLPHNNMPPYKSVYIWERTA